MFCPTGFSLSHNKVVSCIKKTHSCRHAQPHIWLVDWIYLWKYWHGVHTHTNTHRNVWWVPLSRSSFPEFQVTCVFSKDCVLPCPFSPAPDVLIRWYKQEVLINSFPSSEDQSDNSSRMSMLKDQVANGNASLLMQHSTTADRGRYSCRVNSTGDSDGSIVIVKVEGE